MDQIIITAQVVEDMMSEPFWRYALPQALDVKKAEGYRIYLRDEAGREKELI